MLGPGKAAIGTGVGRTVPHEGEMAIFTPDQGYQSFFVARDIAQELDVDLEKLRRQVDSLHETAETDGQLGLIVDRLNEIEQTIESASRSNERLRAKVVLPSAEDMAVRLVPSNSLDRLEEYRSDETKAYLLIGIFLGAVLGILSNWITDPGFEITRVSGAFMIIFSALAVLAAGWAAQVSARSRRVRSRLLGQKPGEATQGQEAQEAALVSQEDGEAS